MVIFHLDYREIDAKGLENKNLLLELFFLNVFSKNLLLSQHFESSPIILKVQSNLDKK